MSSISEIDPDSLPESVEYFSASIPYVFVSSDERLIEFASWCKLKSYYVNDCRIVVCQSWEDAKDMIYCMYSAHDDLQYTFLNNLPILLGEYCERKFV